MENWIHFEEDSEEDSEEDFEEDSEQDSKENSEEDSEEDSDEDSDSENTGGNNLEETLDSQNSKVRNVSFSEPLIMGTKLDDPDMADELRAYRTDVCAQRRADQDRYNRKFRINS